MKYILTLFVLFFLSSSFVFPQDSVIFYNGRNLKGRIIDFNNNETVFRFELKKKKHIKTKVLAKEDIFALYYKDSVEKVLYAPIATDENPLTILEMKSLIGGENLARYRYHPRWATVCGAVTGVGGIYLGFWGIAIPAAYVAVAAAVPVKAKRKKYFPVEKLNDELYIEGFKHEAKRKKLVNAAIGGASGVVVLGTILAILTGKNYIK
ncbi:MAG: hypothetical protein WCQ95_03955 [Bacteroidota bacterium]